MHLLKFIFLAPAIVLAACANGPSGTPIDAPIIATPPNASPIATIVDAVPNFVQDAQDAQWNDSQAVSIGVLPPTDPGLSCRNAVNAALNIPNLNPDGTQPAPGTLPIPASFTPKVTGPQSAGSVAYIRVQQFKAQSGGLSIANLRKLIPPDCYALLGEIQVDALALQMQGAALAGTVVGATQGIPPILPVGVKAPVKKP